MNASTDPPKGELELIRLIGRELMNHAPTSPGHADAAAVGFGDDMATLAAKDATLLWTTDMLMDAVHFDSSRHDWRSIGRKAMAVNLSDCAAMAATPVAALCAVSLCNSLSMADALELLRGACDCGRRFNCPVVGGDTNSWDHPTVICLSVAARCDAGSGPVRRDGARPGDRIFLSGRVGGSILGRHMCFDPRIDAALAVNRELRPHAMIDISDGLAIDLARILDASGCGSDIDDSALDAVIHPDAVRLAQQDGVSPRDHALHDGEDFELIVVLPPKAPQDVCDRLKLLPLGTVTESGFVLTGSDGRQTPIQPRGWEHFR